MILGRITKDPSADLSNVSQLHPCQGTHRWDTVDSFTKLNKWKPLCHSNPECHTCEAKMLKSSDLNTGGVENSRGKRDSDLPQDPSCMEGRWGRDGAASAQTLHPALVCATGAEGAEATTGTSPELSLFPLLSSTAILESLSPPKGANLSAADCRFSPRCSSLCSVRKVSRDEQN